MDMQNIENQLGDLKEQLEMVNKNTAENKAALIAQHGFEVVLREIGPLHGAAFSLSPSHHQPKTSQHAPNSERGGFGDGAILRMDRING